MTTAEFHARAGEGILRLRTAHAALAVAALAVLGTAVDRSAGAPVDPWVVLVVVAGTALATAVPVRAQVRAAHDTAQAHVAVIVPAVHLMPWSAVVVTVAGGMVIGWLLRRLPGIPGAPPASRPVDGLASVTRAVLAAGAASAVGSAPIATSTPFVRSVAAGVAFLVVSRGIVAVTDSVGRGVLATPHVAARAGWPEAAIQLAALASGLVAAMVASAYAVPAAWLGLQVALGAGVAIAMFTIDTSRTHHTALVRIAAHAHASMDVPTVERAVHDNLAPLVRAAAVEVRDLPPAHGDVGTALPLEGGEPAWLVATHRGRGSQGFSERDRRLLTAAAPLVATAVENARRHSDMTVRATVDPLTGAANRRAFEEQMALRLRQGRVTDVVTALAVLDLDQFKAVNDEISHRAGDELLVEVARRLRAAVRAGDLVARLGGDEFAVVTSLPSPDSEAALHDRLARRLDDLRASDGRVVGVSLGIAVAPGDGDTTRQLYDAADARMYAVKQDSQRDARG